MDTLDVKIFRALMYESAVAPSNAQVNLSLRSIAARIGENDTTVNYRYKRMQESGSLSGWYLIVNPRFFGCGMLDVTVDVQPESAKKDMIRKLRLIHEVTGMVDLYGRGLKMLVMYSSEESRSRTIELISRITNAETITQIRWAIPQCRTERLTETDVAIIRALSHDARKSFVGVSKELHFSTRTVRNRLGRLRRENMVFVLTVLNPGSIPGLIPFYLSYSYTRKEEKGKVDRAMLSHFEANYFASQFTDPVNGYVFLSASTMVEVQDWLEWAKEQPGVASARADVIIGIQMFPEKLIELVERREERSAVQRGASF